MRTIVIAGAAVAVVAVAAVSWVKSSPFAPSAAEPLGRRTSIDAWIAKAGFGAARVDPEAPPPPREDGRRELRLEHAFAESLAHASELVLVEDGDRSVFALTARFWSGKDEVRHPGANGAKSEILAFTLWKDLAGELPAFRAQFAGSGRLARQVLVAEFARAGAKGRWLKTYDSNGDARTIWDVVLFTRE
ncbi:MAG: hypothetical protein HZB39_15835 [Planctomycetes bacterium]|nr:hypothetical protein [Planctomycetota bacterium]